MLGQRGFLRSEKRHKVRLMTYKIRVDVCILAHLFLSCQLLTVLGRFGLLFVPERPVPTRSPSCQLGRYLALSATSQMC
jgi:hypothetical protein